MSVFVGPALRWQNARIPYEVQGSEAHLHRGMQEINKCLGYHILVDKRNNDTAWIRVSNGGGKANNIGYRGAMMHTITAPNARDIVHEALHVLGFLHEQYHRLYAWDDNHPQRAPAADFKTRVFHDYHLDQGLQGSPWNVALYQQLRIGYGTDFGANGQLAFLHSARSDNSVVHHAYCDLDSVMMYSEFVNAYNAVAGTGIQPPAGTNVQASGTVGPLGILSSADVAALRLMYPDPRRRCVKCGAVHGAMPSVVHQWHRCPACFAVYCPTCGSNLPGKGAMLNPYRNCDRPGCNARTAFA
jgi:hypothetical protein